MSMSYLTDEQLCTDFRIFRDKTVDDHDCRVATVFDTEQQFVLQTILQITQHFESITQPIIVNISLQQYVIH